MQLGMYDFVSCLSHFIASILFHLACHLLALCITFLASFLHVNRDHCAHFDVNV